MGIEHRAKLEEWNDGILGRGLEVGSKTQTAEDAPLRTEDSKKKLTADGRREHRSHRE